MQPPGLMTSSAASIAATVVLSLVAVSSLLPCRGRYPRLKQINAALLLPTCSCIVEWHPKI